MPHGKAPLSGTTFVQLAGQSLSAFAPVLKTPFHQLREGSRSRGCFNERFLCVSLGTVYTARGSLRPRANLLTRLASTKGFSLFTCDKIKSPFQRWVLTFLEIKAHEG